MAMAAHRRRRNSWPQGLKDKPCGLANLEKPGKIVGTRMLARAKQTALFGGSFLVGGPLFRLGEPTTAVSAFGLAHSAMSATLHRLNGRRSPNARSGTRRSVTSMAPRD